ncbi:MAG: hypothetical protein GY816_00570 [Cytophagales bacterium]|nr:hypothetical protein [Cytophagales bacterium]
MLLLLLGISVSLNVLSFRGHFTKQRRVLERQAQHLQKILNRTVNQKNLPETITLKTKEAIRNVI